MGDVDADGYPDAATGGSLGATDGNVAFYRGGPRGLTESGVTILECPHEGLELFGLAVINGGDTDGDGDGYAPRDAAVVFSTEDCAGVGEALTYTVWDCDDADPARSPRADEAVDDGVDQDCDDRETCYRDEDADGYRPENWLIESVDLDCDDLGEAGTGVPDGDCDDEDAASYPGAPDLLADGVDQDCDGADGPAPPPTEGEAEEKAPAEKGASACSAVEGGPWVLMCSVEQRHIGDLHEHLNQLTVPVAIAHLIGGELADRAVAGAFRSADRERTAPYRPLARRRRRQARSAAPSTPAPASSPPPHPHPSSVGWAASSSHRYDVTTRSAPSTRSTTRTRKPLADASKLRVSRKGSASTTALPAVSPSTTHCRTAPVPPVTVAVQGMSSGVSASVRLPVEGHSSTMGSSGPWSFTTVSPARIPSRSAAAESSSAHTIVVGLPSGLSRLPGAAPPV